MAHPHPFDLPDAVRPFAHDTTHASYDPAWARPDWQVLSRVNLLLEEFAARFSGKVSPVHHLWHTFDIAPTRFGDRPIDQPPTAAPVTREADAQTAATWPSWALTTPTPAAIPAPACWSSLRAPTRPAPSSPAGTSSAWPARAQSPTPHLRRHHHQ